MVEISKENIEVEKSVIDVEGTIEHVETMKGKIVNFGKKHKKVLIAAGTAVLAIGVGAAACLCNGKSLAGEDDDFEDASSDAECDVF